jgi:hypothetical protein
VIKLLQVSSGFLPREEYEGEKVKEKMTNGKMAKGKWQWENGEGKMAMGKTR